MTANKYFCSHRIQKKNSDLQFHLFSLGQVINITLALDGTANWSATVYQYCSTFFLKTDTIKIRTIVLE